MKTKVDSKQQLEKQALRFQPKQIYLRKTNWKSPKQQQKSLHLRHKKHTSHQNKIRVPGYN